MTFTELIDYAISRQASDVHITVGTNGLCDTSIWGIRDFIGCADSRGIKTYDFRFAD